MSPRRRFLRLWNGIALILLFAGIFFNLNLFGRTSTTTVAILMWIIGGTVGNMLFGKDTKQQKRMSADEVNRSQYPVQLTCMSCGSRVDSDARFCPECGTTIDTGTH